MRRLLAIAVPAVLLLCAPASAPAKGIVSAKVCGADGCDPIAKPDFGLLGGGAPTDPPARPEPFVRLSIRVGVPDHVEAIRLLYLPRSELLLGGDGGTWMVPMARGELRAIARMVTPFAASELPASATTAGSGDPLPPEISRAPASPAPAGAANGGGFDAWWLAVPVAATALAAGVALARRRRRDPPATAAGAPG